MDSGLVGAPYCIAFDWVGRNMYIGNILASEISLIRVDGKTKYRMLVLDSRGGEKGVAEPISLAVHPNSGQLFWLDRGGRGVPTKIGKVNMDGTESKILIQDDLEMPDFMTIDIQKEILYFSSSHNPKVESCNLDGSNRRTILSRESNHNIAKVTGIAVMDRRLYYLDPKYEKVARVDSSDGSNEHVLIDNEADLRTLNIFRKRQRNLDHPCLSNRGGCAQICIPYGRNQRKCGCSIGYQIGDTDTECKNFENLTVLNGFLYLQEVREVPEEEVVETTVALPIIQEQEHEIEPVEPVEVAKETVKTVMESNKATKEDIQPQVEDQPSTQLEPEVSKENFQTDSNPSVKQSQEPAEKSMLILYWLIIKTTLPRHFCIKSTVKTSNQFYLLSNSQIQTRN